MAAIASGDYAVGNIYVAGSGSGSGSNSNAGNGNTSASNYHPLPIEINDWTLSPIAPAGIISSTSGDMAQWMRFHLNLGAVNNTSIVSAATIQAIRQPNIPVGEGLSYYLPGNSISYDTRTYAYGFLNGQYRGYRWLWHDGGTLGHATLLTLLTDAKVGVFTSINGQQGQEELLNMLIAYYTLDLVLGLPPWLTVQSACAMKHAADRDRDSAASADTPTKTAQNDEQERRVNSMYDAAVLQSKSVCQTTVASAAPTATASASTGTSPYTGTYSSTFAGTITIDFDADPSTPTGTINRMSFDLIPYPWPTPSPPPPAAYGMWTTGWGNLVNANASYPLQFVPACPDGSIPGLYIAISEIGMYYFTKTA